MARLIAITYGGYVVGLGGTSSSVVLTGKYLYTESYTEATVEFECVVRNATRATFLSAEAALVAALTKPDQDLSVALGGTNRANFSHASNTGFNGRATCRKLGGEEDTANSARYACAVTVQLPADLTGRDGRQSSDVDVQADVNGARTIVVNAVYTALAGSSARAKVEATGETYAAAVVASIGGTYERLNRGAGYSYDDQNKVAKFRAVFQEVVGRQSLSATDHAAIKSPRLVVSRQTPTDDSDPSFNTRPLEALLAVYTATIDKNEAEGVEELHALYTTVIYPLIRAELELVAGSTVIVQDHTFALGPNGNTIEARVSCLADYGADFYRATLDSEDLIQHGIDFAPVWSGDPYEVDVYQFPATHLKIVTRMTVSHADKPPAARLMIPELPGFIEVEQRRKETFNSWGIPGDKIPYQTVTHTFVFRKATVSEVAEATGRTATGTPGNGATIETVSRSPLGVRKQSES
jgi:hypothetical protein